MLLPSFQRKHTFSVRKQVGIARTEVLQHAAARRTAKQCRPSQTSTGFSAPADAPPRFCQAQGRRPTVRKSWRSADPIPPAPPRHQIGGGRTGTLPRPRRGRSNSEPHPRFAAYLIPGPYRIRRPASARAPRARPQWRVTPSLAIVGFLQPPFCSLKCVVNAITC